MEYLPTIFRIAQTELNIVEVDKFFSFHQVQEPDDIFEVTGAEGLIALAGRRCYKSFDVKCNKNLTKVRTDTKEYIGNILKSCHGSVLEHATVTFAIENVSRVFTHELVRHRAGCAYSQESLRFVRVQPYTIPFPMIYQTSLTEEKQNQVKELFERAQVKSYELQEQLAEICDLDNPKMPFHLKKQFQSANRRLLHDGHLTGIVFTANHRALRHLIELRTASGAEEELQFVFSMIAEQLQTNFPMLYQDMIPFEQRVIQDVLTHGYKFTNSKI